MGDLGMLTIFVAAAVLCARAGRGFRVGAARACEPRDVERRRQGRERAYRAAVVFWSVAAIACLGLAVDVRVDLLDRLTATVRTVAAAGGWYGDRRPLQVLLVIVVAGGTAACLAGALAATRGLLPRHAPAFLGLALVVAVRAIDGISYHDLDAFLGGSPGGVPVRFLLEGAGIVVVAVTAVACRRPRSAPA